MSRDKFRVRLKLDFGSEAREYGDIRSRELEFNRVELGIEKVKKEINTKPENN
jgi:hypothetical protein